MQPNLKVNELDRLFDESLNRLKGQAPISGINSMSPLTSDHLMLKKSWEYFHARVKTIEEQWKKIVEAKDQEKAAIIEENARLRKEIEELEEEKRLFTAMEEEFDRLRLKDYKEFDSNTDRVRARWEEERETFVQRQSELELQVKKAEGNLEKLSERHEKKERELKDSIVVFQEQLGKQNALHREIQNQWAQDMARKQDEIEALHSKIDLLRAEIEHRDHLMKEAAEKTSSEENKNRDLLRRLIEREQELQAKDEKIRLLSEELELSNREKTSLREGWSREQTEWRELWDREREMWERQRQK